MCYSGENSERGNCMEQLIYGTTKYKQLKKESLSLYGVVPTEIFNASLAVRKRVDYLKSFLKESGLKGYVLGISGGVDSTTAGKLAQMACSELRNEGYQAQFIAVRLPNGVQKDEQDAQDAINFINPDKLVTVNMEDAVNSIAEQSLKEIVNLGDNLTNSQFDFARGNVAARARMTAQYFIAGAYSALVIGTDHSTEGITGFWTKWGDGACDLLVLNGLNKTQVRLVAKELNAPSKLYEKVATADLETLRPGIPDEVALGISFKDLDAFLENKEIDSEVEYKIIKQFYITQHKRKNIPGFPG